MIEKVVKKVKAEAATMILVTPNWPTQPWFNQILVLCIAIYSASAVIPGSINKSSGSNSSTCRKQDIKANGLKRKVSGTVFLQKAYQLRLKSLSSKPAREARHLVMNRPGKSGVVNNKLIPLLVI